MNPITGGWEKEKPAKKIRMRTRDRLPDRTPEPPQNTPIIEIKATNFRQTNVKTRAQWLDHLKNTQE